MMSGIFKPTLGKKILLALSAALIVGGGTFTYFAYRTGMAMLGGYAKSAERSSKGSSSSE